MRKFVPLFAAGFLLAGCAAGADIDKISSRAFATGDYTELSSLAHAGNAEAQWHIGQRYLAGRGGVKQDLGQAEFWLRKAVAQGHAGAMRDLDFLNDLVSNAMTPEDIAGYRVRAANGDADAAYNLGVAYLYGMGGVPRDFGEAVKWYRKAAEQGQPGGQDGLGYMYYYGLGVPQNYITAHVWFNLSARSGYRRFQRNRQIADLALSYEQNAEAARLAELCLLSNYRNCP